MGMSDKWHLSGKSEEMGPTRPVGGGQVVVTYYCCLLVAPTSTGSQGFPSGSADSYSSDSWLPGRYGHGDGRGRGCSSFLKFWGFQLIVSTSRIRRPESCCLPAFHLGMENGRLADLLPFTWSSPVWAAQVLKASSVQVGSQGYNRLFSFGIILSFQSRQWDRERNINILRVYVDNICVLFCNTHSIFGDLSV